MHTAKTQWSTAIRCRHCDSDELVLHGYRLVAGDCIRADATCEACGREMYADFVFDCMQDPDDA